MEELKTENEEIVEDKSVENKKDDDKAKKTNKVLIVIIIILVLLFLLSLATCGSVMVSKGIKQEVNLHVTTPVNGGSVEEESIPVGNIGTGFINEEDLVISTETVDTKEANKDPLKDRKVLFCGYEDSTITNKTTILLKNLEENLDFYMRYNILDSSGKVVFKTDLIPAGQSLVWVPGESLDFGTHALTFNMQPYYQNSDGTWRKLTSASCDVTYTIK